MNNNPIVFLNGDYLPLNDARVPVMDRGFLFGDGVYEVIPVYGHAIFRLAEHLSRLQNSLSLIDIKNPCDDKEWEEIFRNVLDRNISDGDKALYVQVTRGVGERDHLYKDTLVPTIFVMCKPVPQSDYREGVSAITHEDIRWEYCHIKAITLLAGVLLRQNAWRQDGSREAILIRDGMVTEGAASNVFIVKGGEVKTPRKDHHILPGITRDLVVELLHDTGISCEESTISENELVSAEEIWITGSMTGIAPVVRLDGATVGDGQPGPVWHRANELYQDFKLTVSSIP